MIIEAQRPQFLNSEWPNVLEAPDPSISKISFSERLHRCWIESGLKNEARYMKDNFKKSDGEIKKTGS